MKTDELREKIARMIQGRIGNAVNTLAWVIADEVTADHDLENAGEQRAQPWEQILYLETELKQTATAYKCRVAERDRMEAERDEARAELAELKRPEPLSECRRQWELFKNHKITNGGFMDLFDEIQMFRRSEPAADEDELLKKMSYLRYNPTIADSTRKIMELCRDFFTRKPVEANACNCGGETKQTNGLKHEEDDGDSYEIGYEELFDEILIRVEQTGGHNAGTATQQILKLCRDFFTRKPAGEVFYAKIYDGGKAGQKYSGYLKTSKEEACTEAINDEEFQLAEIRIIPAPAKPETARELISLLKCALEDVDSPAADAISRAIKYIEKDTQ